MPLEATVSSGGHPREPAGKDGAAEGGEARGLEVLPSTPRNPSPKAGANLASLPGEKPYLCDKCGRGFNRVDNLRSHVKTVHQGKAGIKILEPEEGGEVSVVTVDDMVTLATEALAATAVTQLTGAGYGQQRAVIDSWPWVAAMGWGACGFPLRLC